ncbi:hypothetical protein [Pararhizobium gei]|uniref:hypothetical protein n=1 Tax=Pararhizobium gei TaxID=1395951 RepID=UPI0023DB405C|nr:hypothetical protein [Rhizobium gei]
MTDFTDCFQVQAPCFSEDGSSCASFFKASMLTHAVTTISYVCDVTDVEVTIEFEIKPDGFFTTDQDFAGFSVMSDPVTIQPNETLTIAADIAGFLQAGTHVDLICRVIADGNTVDGAVNSNSNLEIVE